MGQAGANANQALDQSNLNNSIAQWQGNYNFPWMNLQNLMGIVGGQQWGGQSSGSTTGTSQVTPSLLSSIGSGVGILGSLLKV
jgi:hypothetical protein